jgi:2,5-diamino-6-(ribosylamino)-4(3H)-pyrimidinone 5'-phosphate reductase
VRTVRVDSGGRLNAALLRAGLVDEASLLVHPALVGERGTLPLIFGRLAAPLGATSLGSPSVESLPGGVVWLRYHVAGGREA